MNIFERCNRDCKLGTKALQNVHASLRAFERLCADLPAADHATLSATFAYAAMCYAKPFLNSQGPDGQTIRYSTKHLTACEGFSSQMHKHLLEVRNALVAHDDFTYIEPRLLTMAMEVPPSGTMVPMSMTVTNKCIGYPAKLDDAKMMTLHVAAAFSGVQRKLADDLARLRKIMLDHPDLAEAGKKYAGHYGSFDIAATGTAFDVPVYSNDPWLNVREPDFSSVHNGYRYQRVDIRRDFTGPETIDLANGEQLVIAPRSAVARLSPYGGLSRNPFWLAEFLALADDRRP